MLAKAAGVSGEIDLFFSCKRIASANLSLLPKDAKRKQILASGADRFLQFASSGKAETAGHTSTVEQRTQSTSRAWDSAACSVRAKGGKVCHRLYISQRGKRFFPLLLLLRIYPALPHFFYNVSLFIAVTYLPLDLQLLTKNPLSSCPTIKCTLTLSWSAFLTVERRLGGELNLPIPTCRTWMRAVQSPTTKPARQNGSNYG